MFSNLFNTWSEYGFEIVLVGSILILILFGLYNIIRRRSGTWNERLYHVELKHPDPPKTHYVHRGDSKGEVECRRVLENIFMRPFRKSRPDFLRNDVTEGGFNLELDCFNRELMLAVEYNGRQHYEFTPFFHKSRDAFMNQKYRDYMKRTKCKSHNITLIEVPYTVKLENIEQFIRNELVSRGIDVNKV